MNIFQHLTLDADGWESLKKIISDKNVAEKVLLTDEQNRIIIAEIENETSIIGYAYPQYQDVYDDLLYSMIYNQLKEQYNKMVEAVKDKKFKSFKMMIVTPFRLSSYPRFDFDKLPTKIAGYTYLSEYPNLDKKKFQLRLDENIWRYINQQ